jgi:hypothetical protein
MATVNESQQLPAFDSYRAFVSMPGRIGLRALDPATVAEMIQLTLDAIKRALSSGTVEYQIGSRRLKRYSLADLRGILEFWIQQETIAKAGAAISSKRIIPSDG